MKRHVKQIRTRTGTNKSLQVFSNFNRQFSTGIFQCLWSLFLFCVFLTGITIPQLSCAVETQSSKGSLGTTFDEENAFKYLIVQCDFGPRYPGSEAHERTKEYLIAELKKFSNHVKTQKFTENIDGKELHLTNIIAEFGEQDSETIMLAAHWDTRPIADNEPNPEKRDTPIIGANDGASGVAVLLEVARVLSLKPPKNRILIVLFDGEDYGKGIYEMVLGSRYFANHMNDWSPDWGILLDMIGDKNLEIPIELNSWRAAPNLVKRIWRKAIELNLTAFQPRYGQAIYDDHIPMIEAGIPFVDLIDFDYPYWHTVEDTPDKCSADSLEVVGRLVLAMIYEN